MKNNKFSGNINKLFVAFVSFFVISSVVSAADVYHIIHSPEGNALANIQTYSQFYKSTTTSTTNSDYRSSTSCSNAGGYYDTSDCAYYYYKYSVTCSISDTYKSCTLLNGQKEKTYTGATSKYNSSSYCSTVTDTAKVRCRGSRNGGEIITRLGTFVRNGTAKCDFTGNNVTRMEYNNKTYIKGYVTVSKCVKTSQKICKCKITKTSTNGYLAWDYNTPTLWKAKAKAPDGTTATAYCVNPGRHWPPNGHTYTKVPVTTFNISDCKKGVASSAACGFATIMLQAQKKGLSGDYTTMALALRLWASKNDYGDGNLQVGELSTTNPIYQTTANRILNNGYRGTKSKDKIKDLIIAKNDTGLNQLQNAIGLYMDAHNGNGDFFSGEVTGPSQAIDISQEGTFEFDISTNFDPNYTINVKVNSKTSGVTLSSSGLTPCNGGYCLHVTGSISHFDRATCTLNSIQYEVTYQDSRDINAAIYLLTPNNKDYQQFIVLDFRKLETSSLQVIAVPKTLRVNCPPKFECLNPDIDYEDQTTGCHNEGVQGTVKDPTVECIINIKELHDNYEYTDLYVHNTTYANNSYCKVTCRETVTYNMFDEESADSTRFIQYTNGLFKGNNLIASMVGDRECSSEINYNAWKNDYEAANEAVRTTWNTYKRYENIHVLTTPRYEHDECSMPSSSCPDCCNCSDCNCTTVDGEESCQRCCDPGYASSCHTSMNWVIWDTKAYTETGPNGNAISSSTSDKDGYIACGGNTCSGHYCNSTNGNPQKWYGAYTSSKSAYENALKKREALVSIIQDCNMYSSYRLNTLDNSGYTRDNKDSIYYESTEGYDFDPVLDYEYDDDYSSNIKIEEESKLTDKSEAKYCVGCISEKDVGATKEERVDYWVCRGQGTGALCTKQKLTVPINTLAYIQAQKIAYFWQSTEFSSTVPAGDIVTSEDNTDDNVLELTDKNIFPLEIGKLSGKYDNKAHHSQVGDKDRKEAVKFEEGDYECDFEVENLITILPNNDEIPDPDDTECYTCGENGKYGFYYRTIDLDNVFPTGVKTGTWSTVRAQHLIEDIESKGESIYTKTPDYEFVITPANIRNIKEYNRDQNMYGEGYNDFNLQCECTTGICYCDSSFLRELGAGGSLSHLVTSYKRNGVEY